MTTSTFKNDLNRASSPRLPKQSPLTSDDIQRRHSIELELEDLDESLLHLFERIPIIPKTPSSTSPQTGGITEDALKQFRSRVARRIYFYTPLLREYCSLYDRLSLDDPTRQHCEEFYKHHKENLQKYKTELSSWWRTIERQFHRLRVASLLSEGLIEINHKEQQPEQQLQSRPSSWMNILRNKSSNVSDSRVLVGLRSIKQSMEAEVNKMEATGEALEKSSQKLESADSLFSQFGNHLSTALCKLNNIKRRAEKDSTYVWCAFVFFVSICLFILLKRTKVLRIGLWIINRGLNLVLFSTKTVYSITLFSLPEGFRYSHSAELRTLSSTFAQTEMLTKSLLPLSQPSTIETTDSIVVDPLSTDQIQNIRILECKEHVLEEVPSVVDRSQEIDLLLDREVSQNSYRISSSDSIADNHVLAASLPFAGAPIPVETELIPCNQKNSRDDVAPRSEVIQSECLHQLINVTHTAVMQEIVEDLVGKSNSTKNESTLFNSIDLDIDGIYGEINIPKNALQPGLPVAHKENVSDNGNHVSQIIPLPGNKLVNSTLEISSIGDVPKGELVETFHPLEKTILSVEQNSLQDHDEIMAGSIATSTMYADGIEDAPPIPDETGKPESLVGESIVNPIMLLTADAEGASETVQNHVDDATADKLVESIDEPVTIMSSVQLNH